MVRKKKHGGVRPGSGRKKIADKKQSVPLYVQSSAIEKVGGRLEAKRIGEQAVLAAAGV